MKKDKRNKVKIKLSTVIIFIALVLLIGTGIYFFLTAEDSDSSLTLIEKQWIEKNKTTLIDFKVPSNLSVLSSNGEGVIFDFIDKLEYDTKLSFNKVSYNYPGTYDANTDGLGIYVLKSSDVVFDSDILMMEDNYVLLGTESGFLKSEKDIYGKTVGIVSYDSDQIKDYFNSNITIKTYNNMTALYSAIKDGSINYGIAPRYVSLSQATIDDKINIKFSFGGITNKIVLRLGTDEKLNNIVAKYMKKFIKNDLRKSFEDSLMNYYIENTNTTDIEKASLTSKVFKYGYVDGSVYNIEKNNKLYGVGGEYINTLSDMANITFEYVKYKDIDSLKQALDEGKVDIAFVDGNIDTNYKATLSSISSTMVVLANNYQSLNDESGLSNRKVFIEDDSYLSDYISSNYNVALVGFKKIPTSISDDALLLLDECYYQYYLDKDGCSYKLLFTEDYDNDYHFVVSDKEKVLFNLTNYVLESVDSNRQKTMSINNLASTVKRNQSFTSIYIVVLLIILVPIISVVVISFIAKKAKKIKAGKKEDVLKYNDLLTSLKNRNYLNANINNWDETKIFPRTIVIIDLNNLKYVNDNYGHEEGNDLIKKAAAILINNQLEKSEIIRTDGNEFLIYMIGYSKTQVNTYITKLAKEFEALPHGFGAAVGFSMIDDEIKTIDDAINEATIEMRIDKEQNYR